MKQVINTLSLVGIPLFALALAGPASAQATRTWVSGVGDDANPCSRTAPCKTFAGAIAKTAPGGEIDALDPGGFGAVTVTKSITINGDNGPGVAGVLVSGTNGITVIAGASDVVVIRGIVLEGIGNSSGTPGINGVNIVAAGEVHIFNSSIKGFTTYPGVGVNVQPNSANVKVTIDNCQFLDNGSSSFGAGVLVNPGGAFKASVDITRSSFKGNTVGVKVDGSTGTGASAVHISNSTISHSLGQGLLVSSPSGGMVNLLLDNSLVADNGSPGLRVSGANATATVGRSTFSGNGGPGLQAQSGGVLNSYQNNQSILNGAPDSATVTVTYH